MLRLFVLEDANLQWLLAKTDGYREVGCTFSSMKEIRVWVKYKKIPKGEWRVKDAQGNLIYPKMPKE